MKIFSLLFFFSETVLAVGTFQVSVVERPTREHPFAEARHFRYEAETKTGWSVGNHSGQTFWSKRVLADERAGELEKEVRQLAGLPAEKKPSSGKDEFRFLVDGKTLDWRDYATSEPKTRAGKTRSFFEKLAEFRPYDGALSFKIACESLTPEGEVSVRVRNDGTKPARLEPIAKHFLFHWGYLPFFTGDAAKELEIAPQQTVTWRWKLDPKTFVQSSARTQLLAITEGLVDTGAPKEVTPHYAEIQRCDIPTKLGALPKAFDESLPGGALADLKGTWAFHETATLGETFYLVVDDKTATFMGAENFGEHGVGFYVTDAKNVKANRSKQLRFELDSVKYYSKAFTPKRRAPAAREKDIGAGRLDLTFEGQLENDVLSLRCKGKREECAAPIFVFKRVKE